MKKASNSEVVIVHSSDLHLGSDSITDSCRSSDPMHLLRGVLQTAASARADVVVLAGDTFDHNRQPPALLDDAARTLNEFGFPVVILPGNHDPLTPDSVYRRAELAIPANVSVLGLSVAEAVTFPHLDLEIWGRAHLDYLDMSPLDRPRPRSTRWQLAVAHGHYIEEPEVPGRFIGSWLIRPADLVAAGADYVALGHWNRAERVGDDGIMAYYSGCPDYAGTVNVVRLGSGAVEVTREPLVIQ